MSRAVLLLALGVVSAGATAGAHHSIAAVYDSSRQTTLEAVVVRFDFINPHPLIAVAVEAADGTTEEWRLEMDNRSELARVGMTADTFQPGDRVVVSGSLSRKSPRGLYIRRLERPADGFEYEQVGSSPRVRQRR
jgi:hypothetical protein